MKVKPTGKHRIFGERMTQKHARAALPILILYAQQKITIIADDNDVLKSIKGLKIPFIKKHPLFRILTDAPSAYENKKEGQKIRAKNDNPKIDLIIEDE